MGGPFSAVGGGGSGKRGYVAHDHRHGIGIFRGADKPALLSRLHAADVAHRDWPPDGWHQHGHDALRAVALLHHLRVPPVLEHVQRPRILTGRSALHFKGCRGFLLIAAIIFVGQILIVEFGGELFNVTPLLFTDWLIIIVCTSIVLWIGEAIRAFDRIR